jgi:hypothetical protein
MNNDNNNVVQFPKKQTKKLYTTQSGFGDFFSSPGHDVNFTFSFDAIELNCKSDQQHTVNTKMVSWEQTTNTDAADELSRIIDLCAALQKNSAQQALRGNRGVLAVIENCLREAVSISSNTDS